MSALGDFLASLRPAWMADANCRGLDPELFYGDRGENHDIRNAKAVCRQCDVQAECLAYAVNNGEKFGIWGGMSEKQRRQIRRTYGVSERRTPPECGTDAAYRAHLAAGESCARCREMANARRFDHQQRKRGAA